MFVLKKTIFKGSGVAIITPMNEDGSINFEEMGKLIDFHLSNNTDAIIVCGTTGESATLTSEEHSNLIKFTVERVNKKIPVIAGTGSNNTNHAIELSKQAEKLGADALLVVTPYYNKTSQTGLVKHYFAIADEVNIPIILYNVPSRTGCNIKAETYVELAKHKNIVAVKEASGNISAVAEIAAKCGDSLDIYSGNDDQIVPILSLGGVGVISVLANAQLSANIDDAFVEELCLVDADHIDIRGHQQDVLRRFDRRRADGVGVVRDDLLLRVADVDAGLEDLYPLVGELCAFEAADQLLGFAREHRAADHFDPALAAGIFQKHVVCAVFSFRRVVKLPDGLRLSRESLLSPLPGDPVFGNPCSAERRRLRDGGQR